jgi:3-oxoacyl-[acyl-carrier protein] reductase
VSDFLVELGESRRARWFVKRLGLPLPLPRKLRRARGPWEARPLDGATVVFGGAPGGREADPRVGLAALVAKTLVLAGADPHVVGRAEAPPSTFAIFRELGEAFGRPPTALELGALPAKLRAEALVFDATNIDEPTGLRALYDFFHPLVTRLASGGRVVVLGRPAMRAPSPGAAAAQGALEGFVRSLAKEIGARGATAQLLVVNPGAEARVGPVLRFVLSRRAAFVTGQSISIDASVPADPEPPLVRPLEGKVALVTGAARGIGEATSRLLAAEGAHVVCLDRPADDGPAAQVARSIAGSLLLADVSDGEAGPTIARHLRERHGGVDIVVHNAGVTRDRTLARMEGAAWDQTLAINLAAIARIDDVLLGGVLRDGGRLICLASVAGIAGNRGQTNYAASKSGVSAYVRRRAELLAPRGITVNAVAPGFIETRLTAAIPMMIREGGRRLSALSQGGLPGDVGEVITFLATPGAAGITGAVVRVCGGGFLGA